MQQIDLYLSLVDKILQRNTIPYTLSITSDMPMHDHGWQFNVKL